MWDESWCGDTLYPPDFLRDVCDLCPVRRECLVDALLHGDGCVRGGLSRRQRAALLRPRRRRSCPVCTSPLPVAVDGSRGPVQVCPRCGISWRTMRAKALAAAAQVASA